VNKTITFLLIFFFSTNCSLNNTTGFWSKSEKLKTENTLIEKEIFQESEIYEKEFNTNLKIKLKNNFKNKSFINNLSNNNGVVNFKGSLKKVSKYKFSKITQFDYFQPELLLTNRNSLIFFENKSRKKNRFNHNRFKVVNSDISGAFFTGIRFVLILGIMLMFYSILMLLS